MKIRRDKQGIEHIVVGAPEVRASVLYAMSTVMAVSDVAYAYPDLSQAQVDGVIELFARAEQYVGAGAGLGQVEMTAIMLLRDEEAM